MVISKRGNLKFKLVFVRFFEGIAYSVLGTRFG